MKILEVYIERLPVTNAPIFFRKHDKKRIEPGDFFGSDLIFQRVDANRVMIVTGPRNFPRGIISNAQFEEFSVPELEYTEEITDIDRILSKYE